MQTSVRILDTVPVTHNVRHYRLERPKGFGFSPGQATEVSIDRAGWQDKKRPFTFTSLPDAEILEFTIKSYFDHNGVTNELWSLGAGDHLILRDVWGTIQYKGPGTFIAGGAGVTPFIAILRHLNATHRIAGNRLIVSNQTEKDIILRDEFEAMAGLDVLWTVTNDSRSSLLQERIDADFLKRHVQDLEQNFYLCGPDPMVKDLRALLEGAGADVGNVTWER
ncbi:flavodoxin reductase [Devosia sp. XJ19-1]|uniref:Flavodoxin reductase n=1 Tax=Devosia ureilytica TaxID=2952754 RepID=A0A9Q4AMR7_9HYPH|nr:flavodoxin reductase [Devosia ureilytica]MCP8883082.1 flavodoxin reductase [Devosia ureilytica]MCP8886550.1 flavodoxin reductase [Devosia ureilytica]